MILDIVKTANELWKLITGMKGDAAPKCEKLGTYFGGIAETLRQVASSLKQGDTPHEKIAQLAQYAEVIPEALGKSLTLMKADDLVLRLRTAVASLLPEAQVDREEAITQIEQAAGTFQALGESCRIHY